MGDMRLLSVFAVFVFVALAVPAAAQTPNTGMVAVGGDLGVLVPDDDFEKTVTVDGLVEYYVAPRFSLRGMLAWASPGVNGRTEDHYRQVKLLFNGVYSWKGGAWQPFVTAGAGAYFVRLKREGKPDPSGEKRGGINLGGGIEFFATQLTAVKGEIRWDIVSNPPGQPDATGFNVTIGLQRYF